MAAYNKFNAFVHDITAKVHNLDSDTVKVMLTNSAPSVTNAVKTDITEISAGNGYSAGGTAPSITSNGQTSGTEKYVLGNVTFTASGGSIGPFRYAVLYNSTAGSGQLISFYDYGSSVTLASGDQFTVAFDASNGVFQLA